MNRLLLSGCLIQTSVSSIEYSCHIHPKGVGLYLIFQCTQN